MAKPRPVHFGSSRRRTASTKGVDAADNQSESRALYPRYPLSALVIYNGCTVLHFLLGALGIAVGYSLSPWLGYALGGLYLAFALIEMYVMMPLQVCPNCVYYGLEGSRCVSGLNVVARRIAGKGNTRDFGQRAEGLFCNNNLYMTALVLPIAALVPMLVARFSFLLLGVFVALVALLLFRYFVIFRKIGCLHCRGKQICPQAGQMGLCEL